MARRAHILRAAAVALSVAVAGLVPAGRPAGAAGEITHSWMAASAIGRVDVPALRTLLEAHADQVRAGAFFPDGGYYFDDGRAWGEEAHWGRFTDAYVERIRARGDCGDLTDPDGPCAAEIAHLMGVRAHGTGDEVWDWLFEPYSPDLDEYYLPEALRPFSDGSGQELTMDLVAIGLHGIPTGPMPSPPSVPDLIAAFGASGVDGVTPRMLADAHDLQNNVFRAEAQWATQHLSGVLRDMPWMSHNMVGAPGGVTYAATAIAAQWEHLWGQLLGEAPRTGVAATYPADGQRRIPPTGWSRDSFQPGSSPGRGGARTRISATLTGTRPYVPAAGGPAVDDALPAGSMTLSEVSTDEPVPLKDGYPRSVPYGAQSGEYSVDVQPAGDLEPCTWYRVEVTDHLLDGTGEPIEPASWQFRTGGDGVNLRCPDDPYTAPESFVLAVYGDLLGREADDGSLGHWTYRMERGLTRAAVGGAVVGSAEYRGRLVDEVYAAYLGRAADAGGRAFWTGRLASRTLTGVRARILGSAELYRAAGGTDASFVARLYQAVLGREPDPAGAAYWSGALTRGSSRAGVAAALLTSREAVARRVDGAYRALLRRPPDPAGAAFWVPRVAAADERVLVRAIVGGGEYLGRIDAG